MTVEADYGVIDNPDEEILIKSVGFVSFFSKSKHFMNKFSAKPK